MTDQLLFAYGTLMDSDVQKKLLGKVLKSEADELNDYELGTVTINGSRYRIIRPRDGGTINGTVLSVNAADLEDLDVYETTAYARKQVSLKSGRTAWAYIEP